MIERLNRALKGRYRIERELGEGGMATVYLAEDLKHDRRVALKVLKPELAAVVGAERFLAEIKTTANLQHPHILPLFDSGEADGFLFYVMPYIEGESLRETLDREHQLPVDEAVELTRRVAAALQHAHDRGIVHRDVKPANILMSGGEPLVADFGIALAVSSAGGGRITETGLSLGTPHYMSPEQASGDRSLDPRSDVYALGCVLYEALAGEPPFPGPTPQAVLARILTGTPQRVSAARPTVPAHVDAAVARSLEKLPADRFATVEDFRKALADPSFRHVRAGAAAVETAGRSPAGRPRPGRWLVPAAAVLLALLAGWGWLRPAPSPPFRMLRVVLDSVGIEFGPTVALSRDGDVLAYLAADAAIRVTALSSGETRVLDTGPLVRTPFLSPDGDAIGYHQGTAQSTSELRWTRASGGGSILLTNSAFPGGTWGEDGYVYYTDIEDQAIWRIRPEGGVPERLTPEGETEYRWPRAIPGDERLIALMTPSDTSQLVVAVFDPGEGTATPVEGAGLRGALDARSAGGFLFWVDARRNLLAARVDLDGARLTSRAVTLVTGVMAAGNRGASELAVGGDGTVLLGVGVQDRTGLGENVVWVGLDGTPSVIEERLADEVGDFDGLALGPDERYVAVQTESPTEAAPSRRIWILDTRQGTLYPLTFDGREFDPEWLPDGRVAYLSDRPGGGTAVLAQPFDRSGAETVLFESDREIDGIESDSEGSLLLTLGAIPDDPSNPSGLYRLDPADTTSLVAFVDTRANEYLPDISPGGRWVAYVSDESGREEVYVRSYPGGGRPWPISTVGGDTPRWGPDGDRLYYEAGGALVVATLEVGDGVEVRDTRTLFPTLPFELSGYEPSADGERLLMIMEDPGGVGLRDWTLMLNVFAEIERRLDS